MKYINIIFISFFLLSCDENQTEEEKVKQYMEHYVLTQYDCYDYFECSTIIEHVDSLYWLADIYREQEQLYRMADQRRTAKANRMLWQLPSISNSLYGSSSFFPNVETAKRNVSLNVVNSYMSKDEQDVCDYVFYEDFVPKVQELLKRIRESDFHGFRIFHSCGFRTTSGAIIYKQFILYKKDDSSFYDVYELRYNYNLIRDFIRECLLVEELVNIDGLSVKNLIQKFDSEKNTNPFSISNKYSIIINKYSLKN
ncbi:hypothetical protein [Dysgonomonas sp. BGC7]|uniref:hypothetical protein n=1 Tax=Dysgonomonas sp. BGC7 TaxID=1658008 RepID=UPI0006809CB4|nr:hypothetical protein [Dysgonomonas sp. BGC7]MBD8389162.1 hypothetical protein [Dysgonomonas sp. BGC7]